MKDDFKVTKAGRRYALAHEAHYGTNDIEKAILMYGLIIKHYPDTHESDYSKTRVKHILNEFIPGKLVNGTLDAMVENLFSKKR